MLKKRPTVSRVVWSVVVVSPSKNVAAWSRAAGLPVPVTGVASPSVLFSGSGSVWSPVTVASSVIVVSALLVGAFTSTRSGSAVSPEATVTS